MSGLSVAHRVALAALLARCSEPVLKSVSATVAGLPGGKAAELRLMLADEMKDRARRALVLAPVAPMFRARADGVHAMIFPPVVLPRLWKAAAEVSSRRSSYSVSPRLDASVGESSYSSFRNVSTSDANDDGTMRLLRSAERGPCPRSGRMGWR